MRARRPAWHNLPMTLRGNVLVVDDERPVGTVLVGLLT
jgi:hypothetical protein